MKISVLGCGWLGMPLGKRLVDEGHIVKGSTTAQEKMSRLQDLHIIPYRIKLYAEGVEGDLESFLSDAEVLLVDIPPGLRKNPEANFTGKIGRLITYIEKAGVERVIFISATSVYGDSEEIPIYTEEDKPNGTSENAAQLISAERQLINNENFKTTVIRFGGLLGPGRHPVKFLSGRKEIKDPKAPVNLIHLEDCIGIILKILEKEAWETTFNAVSPNHPEREHYYTEIAKLKNLALPEFDNKSVSKGKIINSVHVKELLEYDFQHPLL